MWKIIAGVLVVLTVSGPPARAEENVHTLRFFLSPDLVGNLSDGELKSRISQYAEDLNLIFRKQTNRRFRFDPDSGITITSGRPYTGCAGALPEQGYEIWVHAVLTDNPSYGTYGGYASCDTGGAGVAAGLKWDAVYDPSALAAGSPGVEQYWRQIDHVVHECAHVFGAGLGEYYSLACVEDRTGAAPFTGIRKQATDPFWGSRQDYFADPLLNNIYGLPLVGSPTDLDALRRTVRFADVTAAMINRGARRPESLLATLPDLSRVRVEVLDKATGLPIPGAAVRVWNVVSSAPYDTTELEVLATDTAGVFQFAWDPYPAVSVFGNFDHLKLIKACADGHDPGAAWVSIYDAVQQRLIDGHQEMVVSLYLSPEPATLALAALGAAVLAGRARR